MSNEFEKGIPPTDMDAEFDPMWESIMDQARRLPDEKLPGALLEERTIRELRRRGLLRRKRSISNAWLAGSIAASLALFATGMVVGQYLGARSAVRAVAEIQYLNDAATAAAQVQRTGTAYVHALAALANAAQQGRDGGQDASHAREVALSALHEAANEVVRLAPNDPVVAKILQGIEQERKQNQTGPGRLAADRQIVWF